MALLKSVGRRGWIRTSGPFVPNEVRYQAALHTELLMKPMFRDPDSYPRQGLQLLADRRSLQGASA